MSILHLAEPGPITERFFEFIQDGFDCRNHKIFSCTGGAFNFNGYKLHSINSPSKIKTTINVLVFLIKAEKIIVHGLFHPKTLLLLALNPWVLGKCHWVIWGGDLYRKRKNNSLQAILYEKLRAFVIRRFGHLITHIEGDYRLAQQWYGARGKWHECFMYPSNLYQEASIQLLPHEGINILLGNSADPSNNHIEVLEKLKSCSGENIKIYCPLSYGDQSHAQRVSDYGESLFGDKFIPLRNFMPLEEYNKLLAIIDVAIFNHNRQQGMGNIVGLVGLGKKVYLRNDITTWQTLSNIGLVIGDINDIELRPLDDRSANKNKAKIEMYFSRQNLVNSLQKLFTV